MKKKLFKSLLLSCTLALTVPLTLHSQEKTGKRNIFATAGGITSERQIILSIPG